MRPFCDALVASALSLSAVLSACGGATNPPPPDDAARAVDAASATDVAPVRDVAHSSDVAPAADVAPARDASTPPPSDASTQQPDGSTGMHCTGAWQCSDFDACTADACTAGTCVSTPIPACVGCHSDADCDDHDPSTLDSCLSFDRWCSHSRPLCTAATDCADGDACTQDECNGLGNCAHGSVPGCCHRDTDCDDGMPCTTDACSASTNTCSHALDLGCATGCRDSDGDGYRAASCGGNDCDDTRATVHPGATEVCNDHLDNDCNGFVDAADAACRATNTTCAAAATFTPGAAPTEGSIVAMMPVPARSCGPSLFYSFTVAALSDIALDFYVEDPPPTSACPGCPPTMAPPEHIFYGVFVERTCGDTSTDFADPEIGGGVCWSWSTGGTGSVGLRERTFPMRRVPAGTYTIEIQAYNLIDFSTATVIPFHFNATVTPSAAPACPTAVPLTVGSVVHGDTTSGDDAFGLACDGTVGTSAPESLAYFDLATASRVRLALTPHAPAGAGYTPAARVAVYSACDPGSTRTACLETLGGTCGPDGTLEVVLPAGRYWAVVESTSAGGIPFDLALQTEAVGAACAGAIAITTSGSSMGSTAAATDEFRTASVCGDGAGPDTVYALTLAVPSRVVLDLVAGYSGAELSVEASCGGAVVAGRGGATHIDQTLPAGTYTVIVGGETATSAGSFVLNATLVPTS